MLLTFDDGYRDNFDVAVPILRECNAPATFFIPTAFLESPRLPWWDHVACVIKQTHVRRLTVERNPNGGPPPLEIDLQTMSRNAAIMTIIRAFLDERIADEHWFLDRLAERAKVDIDSERLGRELFMSWDQRTQLADSGAGLTIGSHAHSHRKLAELDDDTPAPRADQLEADPGSPARPPDQGTRLSLRLAGYLHAYDEGFGRPSWLSAWPFLLGKASTGSRTSIDMKSAGWGSDRPTPPCLLRARTALHAAFGKSFL